MNETFCTTIRDRRGAIPYYLRPIVQLNTMTLTDTKLEIASASGNLVLICTYSKTSRKELSLLCGCNGIPFIVRMTVYSTFTGTALEKFYFGTDLSGVGYPKSGAETLTKKSDGESTKSLKIIQKSDSDAGNEGITFVISGQLKNLTSLENGTQKYFSGESTTTTFFTSDTGPGDKFVFNRPFLWYLDDARLGPLVYGIVENTENMMGAENPEDDSKFSEEVQRYLMWSCRSFKQSGEIDG